MLPFTENTFKLSVLLIIGTVGFYFWDFGFHPILNMLFKSIIIGSLYTIVIYKMNISDEITLLIKKYLRLK